MEQKEIKNKITKDSLRDLFIATRNVVRDAWGYKKWFMVSLAGVAILVALLPYGVNGVQALLINELVNTVKSEHAIFSASLTVLIGFYIGMFFLRDGSMLVSQYLSKLMFYDFRQRYELIFSEKLATLDVATHEDPAFRDSVQVIEELGSSWAVINFIDRIFALLGNIVGIVSASLIVIFVEPYLFLLIVAASVPRFYTELLYGEGIWSIYQANSEDRRVYLEAKRHTESSTGVRELQTFQTVPFFITRQKELLDRFFAVQKVEERKKFLKLFIAQLLVLGAMGGAIIALVLRVLAGGLEIGTFMFVVGAIFGLEATVSGFFFTLATQYRDGRVVKAYFDILKREPYIKKSKNGVVLTPERAPRIEFQNVSFAYPSKPEEFVLKDFSLTIEPGERIALVGLNGAGKSTLIKLLCRFYDPTKGAIFLDGIDFRGIDLEGWYSHVALLAQDYQTYKFKTWELISLGRLNGGSREQEKIERAAEFAQANTFIEKWEKKYDQQIGVEFSGGVDPSWGERQKLALARTLFRNAFVTILDEPTAHVDARSEKRIFEHLEKGLSKDQTLILVSHRFSSVRNADRICVIEDGKLKEIGSHDDLVSRHGMYAHLFEEQAEGYR